MMMRTAAVVFLLTSQVAVAGSTTATVAVAKQPVPLTVITVGIVADCGLPAGSTVMTMGTAGGDGKPVTFSLGNSPSGDFAISGNIVVVGPNGINPANCGTVENVNVTATQP